MSWRIDSHKLSDQIFIVRGSILGGNRLIWKSLRTYRKKITQLKMPVLNISAFQKLNLEVRT